MQTRRLINNFKVIQPNHIVDQDTAVRWLARKHGEVQNLAAGEPVAESVTRAEVRFRRYSVKPDKIAFRGFDVPDLAGDQATEFFRFADPTRPLTGPSMGDRSRYFVQRALEVMQEVYPTDATPPDHIVHVTCTGYVSPSPPQLLVNERGWHGKTDITHAYHMGCYAAVPAVRLADGLVARDLDARIDIVHTEICTLHMNPLLDSPEQTIVQSLFADGHIRYTVAKDDGQQRGFRVLGIKEELIANTTQDMSWVPEDWGFKMNLSREVPSAIGARLRNFMQTLVDEAEVDLGPLMAKAIFAIHPGGPRIIDSVQEILELTDDQTRDSKAILKARGNMSSATLPHIWQRLSERDLPAGQRIVSLAFGPGLTIFGAVFEVTK